MEQYSNLNVHGKITQKAAQGTTDDDVVKYKTLVDRVPVEIPEPTPSQDEGKALIVNQTGDGFEFGEAGKVDVVQVNGVAIAGDGTQTKIANIVPGTGLTSSGGTINHSNSVTGGAGTIGSSTASSGATLEVPYATYDAQGHVTGKGSHTHTINSLAASTISSGTFVSERLPTATTSVKGAVLITQGTSDTSATVPTVTKMEQYVTTAIGNPMIFKGTVGSSGTVEWSALPAAAAGNRGWTYKVITTHATAPVCEEGDTIISDGSAWVVIPSGDEPDGTVKSIAAGTGLTTNQANAGPITSSGTISLANTAVTAGSYGDDGNTRTLSHGGTFKVPYYSVDAQGRLTASSTKTLTLPGSGNTIGKLIIGVSTSAKTDATTTNTTTFLNLVENNAVQSHHKISGSGATSVAFNTTDGLVITSTDQSVDAVGHHYAPIATDANKITVSASGGSASWNTSVISGFTVSRDAAGHVTAITPTSVKTPANPITTSDVEFTDWPTE